MLGSNPAAAAKFHPIALPGLRRNKSGPPDSVRQSGFWPDSAVCPKLVAEYDSRLSMSCLEG